jgi:hypothetical protein
VVDDDPVEHGLLAVARVDDAPIGCHGNRVPGVVPGCGRDLRSDQVGLVLVVAAELEEERVQPQAADRVHDLRCVPALLAEQPAQYPEAGLAQIGHQPG